MLIVEDSYENLAITDRLIIQKINQNPDIFINVPIVEFARNVNTAISTISKFVRRLGFKNYREFQNYLAKSYLFKKEKSYANLIQNLKKDEDIENLKKFETYAIEETVKMIDQKLLKKITREICDAEKIWIISGEQNILQMQDLCNNLKIVGLNAFATPLPTLHLFELQNLTNRDVVIFMYDNYQSNVYSNLIKTLKENDVTLMVITTLNKFFISDDMDYILNYFAFPPDEVPKWIGNTKVQSFFLNNLLMTYILKQKSNDYQWKNPQRW